MTYTEMKNNEMPLINVTNENGELLVSARDLHEALEIKSEFRVWMPRMIEYGFEENIDFVKVSQKCYTSSTGQSKVDYALKIDMAKEIAMIQRSDKGRQVRKYFIECEKQLQQQTPQLSYKEQLQLQLFSKDDYTVVMAHKELVAIEVAEATGPLLEEIEELETVIDEQADAVAGYKQFLDDSECHTVRDVCKAMGLRERKVFKFFRDKGYIAQNRTHCTRKGQDKGFFVEVYNKHIKKFNMRITNAGCEYLWEHRAEVE